MTKKDPTQIVQNVSDLKSDVKVGQKMFRLAYREEVKRLKKMEKIMKAGMKSKKPATEGDVSVATALLYKELKELLYVNYISNLSYVKTVEKLGQANIVINGIISILGDLTRDSDHKVTKKKIKKIEKTQKALINFQNDILMKVKKKQERLKKSENVNLPYN